MKGYLLVRVAGKAYGLPVGRVLEVGDASEVLTVPRKLPAVRGLTPLRGRLVPLIHLGALLSGTAAPADPVAGVRTVVLVEIGGGGGGGARTRRERRVVRSRSRWTTPTPSYASSRCRCRAARPSRGLWAWRSREKVRGSCRSSISTRWEIGSYDDDQHGWR